MNSIYKVDQSIELPRLGNYIGAGGNGEVYKCYIKIPGQDQESCFACKIEKKVRILPQNHFVIVSMYFQKPLYRKQDLFEEICSLNDEKHFVIIHAYLIGKIICWLCSLYRLRVNTCM